MADIPTFILTHTHYRELFDETATNEELVAVCDTAVKTVDTVSLLDYLARLNFLYFGEPLLHAPTENAACEYLFEGSEALKLLRGMYGVKQVILRESILFCMARVLERPMHPGSIVGNCRELVARMLMAANVIVNELMLFQRRHRDTDSEFAWFLRKLVAQTTRRDSRALARAFNLHRKAKEDERKICIYELFRELSGFSIQDYLLYGFLPYAFYNPRRKNNIFSSAREFYTRPNNYSAEVKSQHKKSVEQFMRSFSGQHEMYMRKERSLYDYSAIYDYPIYQMEDGRMFPLDLEILHEKITNAHIVLPAQRIADKSRTSDGDLRRGGREQIRKINSFWGEQFERYSVEVLTKSVGEWPNGKAIDLTRRINVKGCDALLKERGRVCVLFEFTQEQIGYRHIVASDFSQIQANLKAVFAKDSCKQKGKGFQLEAEYLRVRNGELDDEYDIRSDSKIYPILVMKDAPFWVGKLKQHIRAEMKDWKIDEYICEEMEVIDIDEFELLCGIIQDRKISISTILDDWKSASDLSFHNFLWSFKDKWWPKNRMAFIEDGLAGFFDSLEDIFIISPDTPRKRY